ncbi:hypothetical protein FA15DRAFT_758152 [Coprinopsis marcescibilis]|uniref:BTB domain-containing protein n=1 Tax=Coprinopsis marcescibilis TaxID=230819 RepID=A0A5C3KP22_COPMA|nr:hypothetical protein FA15DRAFT_758152 [Coprinopsis marcescibilis]
MADSSTPGSESPRLNDLFCWENIWLKVENEFFCVPRRGFTAFPHSKFVAEFLAPASVNEGEAVVHDGRSKENAIHLFGYAKQDFEALLKVMYPIQTYSIGNDNLIDLNQDQWIGVLKLSTLWRMTLIRQYAIAKLSVVTQAAPAAEKVQLAQAYKVLQWMEQGIAKLASSSASVEELEPLGWKVTALVLAVRDSARQSVSPQPGSFRLDSIKCGFCTSNTPLIPFSDSDQFFCPCGIALSPESQVSIQQSTSDVGRAEASTRTALSSIWCHQLTIETDGWGPPHNTTQHVVLAGPSSKKSSLKDIFTCSCCGEVTRRKDTVRVLEGHKSGVKSTAELIQKYFGEEFQLE